MLDKREDEHMNDNHANSIFFIQIRLVSVKPHGIYTSTHTHQDSPMINFPRRPISIYVTEPCYN